VWAERRIVDVKHAGTYSKHLALKNWVTPYNSNSLQISTPPKWQQLQDSLLQWRHTHMAEYNNYSHAMHSDQKNKNEHVMMNLTQ
jgi:hypothetical protein